MVWINFHRPLTKNNDLHLHDVLKASYGDKKYENKITNRGYIKDNSLSNHNQQVWYRPNDKKLLYTVAGTHNLKDWGTDLYLALGKLKDTDRYKDADQTLKVAKEKYKPNDVVVAGHSLGSTISNQIASKGNGDKMYGLDGGFTFGQKISKNPNFTNVRTQGDLVIVLGKDLPAVTT